MKGILALYGSGEFTNAMLSVDKFLLSKTPNPKIAILPTAAGQEEDHKKWITWGIKHYKKLGFVAEGFDIKDKEDANSKIFSEQLNAYNFFVFSGGDPGYLLSTLKNSLVWKSILKNYQSGATLIGSSAGAMAFGQKTWARVYEFEKTGKIKAWDKGLGLTDFGVIPHFNYIKGQSSLEKRSLMEKSFPSDTEVIGIDEDTAYIQFDGKWMAMGSGKVHIPAILIE